MVVTSHLFFMLITMGLHLATAWQMALLRSERASVPQEMLSED